MEWFDRISTGHDVIDGQHRLMMQCLEDLENAVLQKRPLRIAYAISRFREAAVEHLATEEAIMRASSYPRLAEHLAEHEAFRARFNALQQRSVQQDLPYNMVEEMAYWLVLHFFHSDRDCISHIEKQSCA